MLVGVFPMWRECFENRHGYLPFFLYFQFSFKARAVPLLTSPEFPPPTQKKRRWKMQLSSHSTHFSFSIFLTRTPSSLLHERCHCSPCEQTVYKLLWQPLPFWRQAQILHGKQKHPRIRLQLQNKRPRKRQSHSNDCWLCKVQQVQPCE